MTEPLITATALQALLRQDRTAVLVCNCSFDLTDPEAGARAHAAGHLPDAVYVHLDTVLSAPKTGRNGRHPLPSRETFVARMAALGVDDDTLVVAYDESGGMYAARLWWMLRWVGHARVAVLDGGLQAWRAIGGPLQFGPGVVREPGQLTLRESRVPALDYPALLAGLDSGERLIVDARAADRFRGENETLDPVGGRIPGAANRWFKLNLAADGRFKPPAQLREEWQALLGTHRAQDVVQQCGSGVTACHNLLAMEVAGLGTSALYPGSWSEWCAQPGAPVARG